MWWTGSKFGQKKRPRDYNAIKWSETEKDCFDSNDFFLCCAFQSLNSFSLLNEFLNEVFVFCHNGMSFSATVSHCCFFSFVSTNTGINSVYSDSFDVTAWTKQKASLFPSSKNGQVKRTFYKIQCYARLCNGMNVYSTRTCYSTYSYLA